jgi:uncharacterized Ntn-hydrolase superfamily protein
VGSLVPWAKAGVGAIATQALANPSYGPRGLTLLARGRSTGESLSLLLAEDPQREGRQLGAVSATGQATSFTGKNCPGWAGGLTGTTYAIQGNSLTGPEVVDLMELAFRKAEGSLAERLLAALEAGEKAGGDRRGKQSAALLVVKRRGGHGGQNDRYVDLRVDDAESPVAELQRLYVLHARTNLPTIHARLGDEALAVGDQARAELEYARVIRLYRRGIQDAPDDAGLKNGLAWFYVQHRVNLDEALRLAQEAYRLKPRSWQILGTLTQIHFARGQYDEAYRQAQLALRLDPENAYLKSQLARIQNAIVEKERK